MAITVNEVKKICPLADVYELSPQARYFVFLPVMRGRKDKSHKNTGSMIAKLLQSLEIPAVVVIGTRKDSIHFYGLEETTREVKITKFSEVPAELATIRTGPAAGKTVPADIASIAKAIHEGGVSAGPENGRTAGREPSTGPSQDPSDPDISRIPDP